MFSDCLCRLKVLFATMRLLLLMSFAALLRGNNAAGVAPRPGARKQYKYGKQSVEANIGIGERVAAFMSTIYGEARAATLLAKVAVLPFLTAFGVTFLWKEKKLLPEEEEQIAIEETNDEKTYLFIICLHISRDFQ